MHRFEVWAPDARAVDVVIGGERTAMRPEPPGGERHGWWTADVEGAGPGTDYLFSVDGGEPRPDPRSAWQPEGVLGPSRVVDHSAFAWTDDGWRGIPLAASVIYELHVGTFTDEGTFDAAIGRLDHLVDLGVTTVELLPVNEFPGRRGWGYDGVDLWAPHHAYGGPDGLKRFVDAAHGRGLAVILDVVYNHLGPAGNFLPVFGPYFTDTYSTPWGAAVNFDDRGSDEVRAFVIENALMWLRDHHLDGLRLDAVHAIFDRSATHLLEELSLAVDRLEASLGRTISVIAESDLNDPRLVRSRDAHGYGMDAQWSDDLHHALHAVLTGERDGYYADFGGLGELADALRRAFVYAGQHAPHRGRRHGRAPEGLPSHRFLAYLQDHDQVGNRAQGDRTSHLLSDDRLRIGAAVVLCSPFVPMLFMGEEWAALTPWQYFTDHDDPELAQAVRDGRRREFASFGWDPEQIPDPQDPATFERSVLRWDERSDGRHAALLEWHRALIRLRMTEPDLAPGTVGDVDVEVDEAAGSLRMRRGSIVLAVNLGSAAVAVPGVADILLASDGCTAEGGVGTVRPDGVAVFRAAALTA